MIWVRRTIKYGILVLVIIAIADFFVVFFMAHYRRPIPKVDAVIVLGAAINTPSLYNRTLEGLHIYEKGEADEMVLSGGKISPTDISEAEYMQKVIRYNSQVVPPTILEDQSHTTYENLKNSRTKLGEKRDIVVVSDQFHLARAVLTAKRLGFRHVYWSAPEPTYYRNNELRYYYFREVVGVISYIPKFIFG